MPPGSDAKLLVTTALEETWGDTQDILFIGEWCKLYNKQTLIEKRNHETMCFHWSDRKKLHKDYEYIRDLNERIIFELSDALNKYHNINKSLRYWRIILGPWLFLYVPILWDRWESLRLAFEKYDLCETFFHDYPDEKFIPYDYDDLTYLANRHGWNHKIFSDILRGYYKKQIKLTKVTYYASDDILNRPGIRKATLKNKISSWIDKFVGLLQKDSKVIIVNGYFNLRSLIEISFRLNQLPRLNSVFNKQLFYPQVSSEFRNNKLDIGAINIFETFLEDCVVKNIPIAYLEGFPVLKNSASLINQDAGIIFTAISHYNNELFKVWSAEQTEKKNKMFIIDHGGGIPYGMSLMTAHEEKIADKKIVWHVETNSNQLKLSPSKLINYIQKRKPGRDISLVGFESPLYSYFIQSGPTSSLVLEDYRQKNEFVKCLSIKAFNDLRIRPAPDYGWNTKQRYIDAFGKDKISLYKSLKDTIKNSKLLICTYPSTTFSEAMISGVPVIMLYNRDLWELNPYFDDLLIDLFEKNIVFSDPVHAASHIDKILDYPESWWSNPEIEQARENYNNLCGNVQNNWLDEWGTFFDGEQKTCG